MAHLMLVTLGLKSTVLDKIMYSNQNFGAGSLKDTLREGLGLEI